MDVKVIGRGEIAEHTRRAAQEKLEALDDYVQGSLRGARVVLVQESNPRIPLPARAEAEVQLEGWPVRARAAAETMDAAVDEVAERLQRSLRRYVERMIASNRLPAGSAPGQWRHGSWSPPPAPSFRRPVEEREVIRRRSFAADAMSLAEAAATLDALDDEFLLFRHEDSGADCVLHRGDGGRLAVIVPAGTAMATDEAVALQPSRFSEPVGLDAALTQMDALEPRFLFFVDAATGRGSVLYLRYDGHYGLVEPGAGTG